MWCALPHASHLVPRTSDLALLAVGFFYGAAGGSSSADLP
jgi:hypothetical protein